MRFSLREVDGVGQIVAVAEGGRHSGRSAYLCERQSCLERAVARRAFQRAFRTAVEVDKDSLEREIRTVKGEGPCGSECR